MPVPSGAHRATYWGHRHPWEHLRQLPWWKSLTVRNAFRKRSSEGAERLWHQRQTSLAPLVVFAGCPSQPSTCTHGVLLCHAVLVCSFTELSGGSRMLLVTAIEGNPSHVHGDTESSDRPRGMRSCLGLASVADSSLTTPSLSIFRGNCLEMLQNAVFCTKVNAAFFSQHFSNCKHFLARSNEILEEALS